MKQLLQLFLSLAFLSSVAVAQASAAAPPNPVLLEGGQNYRINCACGAQVGSAKGSANGAAFDYTDLDNSASPSGWPDGNPAPSGSRVGATKSYEFEKRTTSYVVVFYDDGTWNLTNVTAGTSTTGTYSPIPG